MSTIFPDDNVNADWTVRHGRSAALFSALKSAPGKLLEISSADQLSTALMSYMSSDRSSLVENAMAGIAFLLTYQLKKGAPVPMQLLQPFAKVNLSCRLSLVLFNPVYEKKRSVWWLDLTQISIKVGYLVVFIFRRQRFIYPSCFSFSLLTTPAMRWNRECAELANIQRRT